MKKIELIGAMTSSIWSPYRSPDSMLRREFPTRSRRRRTNQYACRICNCDASKDKSRVKIAGRKSEIKIVGSRKHAERYFCGECWKGLMKVGK